jgi:hypothetical protein
MTFVLQREGREYSRVEVGEEILVDDNPAPRFLAAEVLHLYHRLKEQGWQVSLHWT